MHACIKQSTACRKTGSLRSLGTALPGTLKKRGHQGDLWKASSVTAHRNSCCSQLATAAKPSAAQVQHASHCTAVGQAHVSAHGCCRELLAASRAYLLPVLVQADRPQQDNMLQLFLGATIIADGISDVRLPSDPRCTGASDQSCCMCHRGMTSAHMRGMRDLEDTAFNL